MNVARARELAVDHESTGVDDALGTEGDPVYIECPFDGSVHDATSDASTFRVATGREVEMDFGSVERVRAPSREADAPGTNEAGRG